jgi:hypothetical protein
MSDGFFSEYAIVDARLCAKLSDKMSYTEVCHSVSLSARAKQELIMCRLLRSLVLARPSTGLSRLPISSLGRLSASAGSERWVIWACSSPKLWSVVNRLRDPRWK